MILIPHITVYVPAQIETTNYVVSKAVEKWAGSGKWVNGWNRVIFGWKLGIGGKWVNFRWKMGKKKSRLPMFHLIHFPLVEKWVMTFQRLSHLHLIRFPPGGKVGNGF
jgi:hypothetical protein